MKTPENAKKNRRGENRGSKKKKERGKEKRDR